MMFVVNFIADCCCLKDVFFADNLAHWNIFFYLMECIEGIVTGMVLAVIFKKGKNAAVCSFFIMLFTIIIFMLSFGSKTFCYIFTILVPAYSVQYEFFMASFAQKFDWPMFWYGIAFTIIHLILYNIIVNW